MVISNHCYLNRSARDWLDGELLGDGSLTTVSYVSARVSYSSKYLEYIQYIANTLASFGIQYSGRTPKRKDRTEYTYVSRQYVELFPIWMRWYAYGKKEVPSDLRLTPITCRQWYIGDGSLMPHAGIRLATDGFDDYDTARLVACLFGIGFPAVVHASGKIYIPRHMVKQFLGYIGACPVECYKYKWDYY